jgi:hypothetical protein
LASVESISLSPQSSPPKDSLRIPPFWRWNGPALAFVGLVILGIIVLPPTVRESPLAWWIVHSALAPQRLLPLFGLGVALGTINARTFAVALMLFVVGICFGFLAQDRMLTALAAVPNAPTNLFITGPIASLAIGLALISSARARPIVLPPTAFVVGAMLALAIVATDPSLHDPTDSIAGTLIGLWIVGSISLTVCAFRCAWFDIFARILGSWLIAIAALYGSAALLPRHELSISPDLTPPSDRSSPFPDIDRDGPAPSDALDLRQR